MRNLTRSGDRFYEPIQIVGGAKTRAVIHRASDGDQPGAEFSTPKTTLRVKSGSIIVPGMVVITPGGEHNLVAEHSQQGDYKTFHLFQTDRKVTWTRQTFVTDVISKQKKAGPPTVFPDIWVMWERTRREFMDLTIRIAQESYLVATGADVHLGDYVDNKQVKRVSQALGIRILELQG